MKQALLGMAALVVALGTVHARIGENDEQLAQRYGAPVNTAPVIDGSPIILKIYHFNGFEVDVLLDVGGSQIETYHKLNGETLTAQEADALLKANSGGSVWSAAQEVAGGKLTFETGGMKAVYDPGAKILLISNVTFAKRYLEEQNAAKEKQLSGF